MIRMFLWFLCWAWGWGGGGGGHGFKGGGLEEYWGGILGDCDVAVPTQGPSCM